MKIRELITKTLEKCGLIPPKFKGNQPCYDKYGRFIGWFSRSMAVVGFIFRKKDGKIEALTIIRGKGAADYQGKRCCICGYVEFNMTLEENLSAEIKQEVNMTHNINNFVMVGIDSSPSSNNQNISVHFMYVLDGTEVFDFENRKGGEVDEVESMEWVDVENLPNDFCFDHNNLIKKYVSRLE